MANSKRQAIIVLGMHRSGTSALAGSLGKLGLRLPSDPLPPMADNPTGYFESKQIVSIHDRVLSAIGSSWSSYEPLDDDWFDSEAAAAFVDELALAIRQDYGDATTFVVKDPRMCRLMPLWRKVLAKVDAQGRFIIPLRNPLEVAQSLKKRNGFSRGHGCLLWLRHVLEAERETRDSLRLFVQYHDLLSSPARVAAFVASQLTEEPLALSKKDENEIQSLIEPGLRHHFALPEQLEGAEALYPWLWNVHEACCTLVELPSDKTAQNQLDRVRTLFDAAVASCGPLTRAYEAEIAQIAEQVTKLSKLDDESAKQKAKISVLDHMLGERNRKIAILGTIVAERESRIATFKHVLAGRDETIAHLSRTIAELYKSRSWKITAPIRGARRVIAGAAKGRTLQFSIRFFRMLRREGFAGVKQRLGRLVRSASRFVSERRRPLSQTDNVSSASKVSVIVPNYNHQPYLRERLESIYAQTYQNFEVILLDDCSTDGSREVLLEYATRFSDKTICHFNEANSGGVFNQWKKGLELATGNFIWIAESDDYCTPNLLAELSKCLENQAVMLAFCRSDFVTGEPPACTWTTEEYWSGIKFGEWKNGFVKPAHWLVNNGWGVRNIIPNVSSALFRHPGKLDLFDAPEWKNLKLCGDWIFYLTIARGGYIAYSPKATNFYRQHAAGTSLTVQKSDNYYLEYETVAKTMLSLYRLNPGVLENQRDDLYQHWTAARGDKASKDFVALYDLDRVWKYARKRKPNLVMVAFAIVAGGGETFPVLLANLFKAKGYAVTFFNAKQEITEPGIRKMIDRSIPMLEMKTLGNLPIVLEEMGTEIVHTHHGTMDLTFSKCLANSLDIKHVVSLHGMYEMMDSAHVGYILPIFDKTVDRFVYAAEKNLSPFPKAFRDAKQFVRIHNALPKTEINPVLRSEFGIEPDAFVLCLVARAIPQKGWEEAIQAAMWARNNSAKKIHILMIGDGPEYDRLKPHVDETFVHFVGFRSNIRDYFAASDIGFLCSRFKGESYPLVLIDCLLSGRPVLASNIGEISTMLSGKNGMAGQLFDLQEWTIPVETVGKMIVDLANDRDRYEVLLRNVPDATEKFDLALMVKKYDEVYQSCLDGIKNATKESIQAGRSILLVTHDCYPHGAELLLLQIAKQLKAYGYNVKTLALGDGELFDEFAKIGQAFQGMYSLDEDLREFLTKIKAEGTSDAITSTVVTGSVVPLLKETGFKILSLVHELPAVIRDMYQEHNAEAIGRYADKVVFASDLVFKGFAEFASVTPEQILIRPQGVLRKNPYKGRNTEAHQYICRKHGLALDTKIVLAIAYMQRRKGPDLFIETAAQVLLKNPETTFIWIGDTEKDVEKAVRARIAELGLQDKILILGFEADPMAYYAAASAYALTSREDPFPNVAIESVEVGVPVVAFEGATGAAEYIVEHGGALAKSGDAADFAAKLCYFLANPGLAKTTNSLGSLQQYVLDLLHSLNGLPRVSVVVPNYNYARHITRRLDSVFNQFFPLYEVIILDDASTDGGVETINAYLRRNDLDATVVVNETNSGSVFRQWRQGVKRCKGDLVWIAEADDLAESDFVSSLARSFDDSQVVLAYSESKQIDESGNLLAQNYLDYTKEISDRWKASYTRSGMDEIADALSVKNTIANVSAVLFRRECLEVALDKIGDDLFSYKVAGDWLVYLHVLSQGKVHFHSRPLNWHRRHTNSVTISVANKKHYDEVSKMQKIAQSMSKPTAETLHKAERYMVKLQEHFNLSSRP